MSLWPFLQGCSFPPGIPGQTGIHGCEEGGTGRDNAWRLGTCACPLLRLLAEGNAQGGTYPLFR